MLLRAVTLNERLCDVRLSKDHIAQIAPPNTLPGEAAFTGGRITPPMAEPHVHLDAALLGERAPNRSGTLSEGISNWAVLRESLTVPDVQDRARRTLLMYRARGCLRVRTHVDTGNLLAVAALVELRESMPQDPELCGMELQLVAFPQEGILRARGQRAQWEEAVALGCDAVGAIPHFERTTEEGWRSVRLAFELAERRGLQVDLHCDETDDPSSRNLEVACAEALDRQISHVVAGHCTAMHSYENPYAAKVIQLVVRSGVQVVTNPLDNSVLQGRYDNYPRRRGLTRVDQLWEKGARVGIGHDSVMDPWYRLGQADMMDAAWLLVHMAHLTSEAQMRQVFGTLCGDNHLPFGGPPPLAEGELASLLWWPEVDPVELLRLRARPRVIVRGELLASAPLPVR